MSVKPPKAEVSLSRFDVRYVPKADILFHRSERGRRFGGPVGFAISHGLCPTVCWEANEAGWTVDLITRGQSSRRERRTRIRRRV